VTGEAFTREELAHELVSVNEIAEILGVAPSSASAYASGAHPRSLGPMPPPVARLGCGRVWLRSDIEAWAIERLSKEEN